MLYFSLYYPIHRFFISPTLACLHKKKMIIYLPLLLFTGLAFGVDDSDLIIFRNGLEYYGDFLKVKTDTVYFKPQNSNAYQNVFTFQLDRIKLKNGEVLNFKDVKKPNEPILGKEVFKKPELVLKRRNKILKFNSGQRLIIFNGLEGTFKGINSEHLIINTGNLFDKKIPISLIKSISVPLKTSANIDFKKGACSGAGIALIPIFIMAYEDPLNLMVVPFAAPVGAVLGGLTSFILPKSRKNKVYLIQENEWKIVID